jgi:hypothetical protein
MQGDRDHIDIDSNSEVQHINNFLNNNPKGFIPTLFNKVWAIRASYGKAFGEKCIDEYKDEIDAMYTTGCDDPKK